ncbi:MAG: hypothetical protein HRT61_18960 [Ekhidna sp.]|nr:hypothetical protein [Ekhidna sp.]
MKEAKNNQIVPKWLEDLQQRSWEPEILLSGIVLYGMFKVPNLLDKFESFFKANIFGNSSDINNLVALSKMGIYWLITGLILHLICRGIWIGMVGLSYTFPSGIRKDNLSYKGKFDEKVQSLPSYETIVIRLEKISSSLFSVSFMLFMSLIGGYLFFLVLVILPFTTLYIFFDFWFTGVNYEIFQYYVIVVVVVGVLALIDFLTLGYFRRFSVVARFFWPLHVFVSTLTLSRFYRPIYYGMVSNFNRWAFFLFLLLFTVISLFGARSIAEYKFDGQAYSRLSLWGTTRGYNAYNGYYEDQSQDQSSRQAQIQSDIISGDVLKLFVPANIAYEDEMLELMSLDSLQDVHADTSLLALKLMVVENFYQIKMDGKSLDVDNWFTHYRTSSGQFGYLAFISIRELAEGMHRITIGSKHKRYKTLAIIPFYRDITVISNPKVDQSSRSEEVDFQPKPFAVRE